MIKVTTADEQINLQGISYTGQYRSFNHCHAGVLGHSNGRADFKEL